MSIASANAMLPVAGNGTSDGGGGGAAASDGSGVDPNDESPQAELARVRKLLQEAGNPPQASTVWELSQRLKRAAARQALAGGHGRGGGGGGGGAAGGDSELEVYEALTEEVVRLRLMSRQLKKNEKRGRSARGLRLHS